MNALRKGFLFSSILILSVSCDSKWLNRPSSKNIPTGVSLDRSGTVFGGDSPFFTANLKSVRSESLPYKLPIEKETQRDPNEFHYKVAITADVSAVVIDQNRMPLMPLTAKIRFEALSAYSVVLSYADAEVQFHSGQSMEQASATIYGLNEFEIDRISKIRASWLYSR